MQVFAFSVLAAVSFLGTVAGKCDMCGGTGTPANVDLVVPFLAVRDNANPTCQDVYTFALESVPESDDICTLVQKQKDFCGCPGAAARPIGNCSLCNEGATPANLNAVTPYDDTCNQLDTYLKYMPADQCLTERVQNMMKVDAYCGCPGVEPECTMCSDGTNQLQQPDRKIPYYEFGRTKFTNTCQEMADFYTLYDTGDEGLTTCYIMQMENKYCGCLSNQSNAPANACGFCPDGSKSPKPTKYIDELKMTCGELETYLTYIEADQCSMPWITDLKRFDFFCGCTTAKAFCAMCPDGSIDITNPDAIVPYLVVADNENPTCQELATLGAITEVGELLVDDCSIFTNQANFCGCPNTSKPATGCDFCPGGAAPAKPDLVTPFSDTCSELQDYLSFMTPDECSTERVGFIQRQDFLCGCPSATTECAFCSNHGSNDITYPDRHIPLLSIPLNTNPTCQEIVHFLAINDGDMSDAGCSAIQDYQGYCGCPSTPTVNECSFCPKGGVPANPTKIVSGTFTCQELYDFVSFLPANECGTSSTDFAQVQAYAYVCGCPNVEPHCTLCRDGLNVPDPTRLTQDSDGTTCGEFAEEVASLTLAQCSTEAAEIQAAALACGCGVAIENPPNSPPTKEEGKCGVQFNAEMCTDELLDSVTEDCECYAFCDSRFVRCQSSEGGFLEGSECNGIPITGCNRAGVVRQNEKQTPNWDDDGVTVPPKNGLSQSDLLAVVLGVTVPVVLALLVVVYYFCTRKSKLDEKFDANDDEYAAGDLPIPVQSMEGSISMSDVLSTPPMSPPPPAESFSIAEDDDDDFHDASSPDSKIV